MFDRINGDYVSEYVKFKDYTVLQSDKYQNICKLSTAGMRLSYYPSVTRYGQGGTLKYRMLNLRWGGSGERGKEVLERMRVSTRTVHVDTGHSVRPVCI